MKTNLMHGDRENISHVATDDFISQFRIFVWVISDDFNDFRSERCRLRYGDVINTLSHYRVVVVTIEHSDLKNK